MALGCLKPQSFSNSDQQSAGVGQSVTLHTYVPYIHGRHYNGSWHSPAEPKLNLTTFSTKLIGIHHEMKQAATPVYYTCKAQKALPDFTPASLWGAVYLRVSHLLNLAPAVLSSSGCPLYLGCFFICLVIWDQIISRPFLSFSQVSPSFLLCSPNILFSNHIELKLFISLPH